MGALWLHDLPGWLRSAGLRVREWDGWETRGRSSGGYDDIYAIGVHHDASSPNTSVDSACRYCWESSDNRPVGAVYLARNGEWVVGAAGATNTQGSGGPYPCSRGVIPVDSGNRYMLSIEAANDGVGEPWPLDQQDSLVVGVEAMIAGLRTLGIVLDPLFDVIAHFEWAPTRKIDPAGPSAWTNTHDPYGKWNMAAFRAACSTPPTPIPPPHPEDDEVLDAIYEPKFNSPGYAAATFAVYSTGKVRRAVNPDIDYARVIGAAFLGMTSEEQYDDLHALSGTKYPPRPGSPYA